MFIIKTAVGVMAGGIMFGFKSIHLVTPNSYQQGSSSFSCGCLCWHLQRCSSCLYSNSNELTRPSVVTFKIFQKCSSA